MLKTMRKNVKSLHWVLWLVVATFIVSIFFIWGGAVRLGEGGGANTVAWVGRDKVSSDEYSQELRARIEAVKRQFSGLNAAIIQQYNIPQQVLQQIIQQKILLQIAGQRGLRATDAEVRTGILTDPRLQVEGRFVGYEAYKRALDYSHISLDDFEKSLRTSIVVNKVSSLILAGVAVSDDEVWDSYRKKNDSAKIEYLVSETAKADAPAKPSEAELRAHFDKNAASYKIPEKREGDYLFLKTDDAKKLVKVTDNEIAQYYKDNEAQFKEAEKVKVSRIWLPFTEKDKAAVLAEAKTVLAKAQVGGDFAALAKTTSKDEKAPAGGDWGLFDWKGLNAKETQAIGNLLQGQISGVIELDNGAAILKVTEKTPAVTKTLAEVSATIKSILEDQKARTAVGERIQALDKLARKEKSLDVAAQKEGLKVASTGALSRGQGLGDFDTSGSISNAMFGLKDKEISAPVATYTGAALVELRKVEPERPAKFEEVKDQVEKDILDALKKEKALEKLRQITASLKDDWNAEAGKVKLEYKTVEAHQRDQDLSLVGESPAVDNLVFTLPLKKVSDPVPVEGGYAIFRVLDRKEVTRADFDKVRTTERDTLLEQKKTWFLQSYLAQTRQDLKVRYNGELFTRLTDEMLSRYQGEQ